MVKQKGHLAGLRRRRGPGVPPRELERHLTGATCGATSLAQRGASGLHLLRSVRSGNSLVYPRVPCDRVRRGETVGD